MIDSLPSLEVVSKPTFSPFISLCLCEVQSTSGMFIASDCSAEHLNSEIIFWLLSGKKILLDNDGGFVLLSFQYHLLFCFCGGREGCWIPFIHLFSSKPPPSLCICLYSKVSQKKNKTKTKAESRCCSFSSLILSSIHICLSK